jgi:hypothetical protein
MDEPQPHVTLTLRDRAIRVTRQDGERMRAALIDALSRSTDPALQAEGARVARGGVFVGPDNDLRISAWLLDARDGQPVLVWRQQSSPHALLNRIARLSGSPGARWTVTAIDEELVHGR